MKIKKLSQIVADFLGNERGATAIEYGLIASGIVMLVLVSLGSVSTQVNGTFVSTAAELAKNNKAG